MSLLANITHALSNGWNDLFGQSDDEKKKQSQQQARMQAPQKITPNLSGDNSVAPNLAPQSLPDTSINLHRAPIDASTLVKANKPVVVPAAPAPLIKIVSAQQNQPVQQRPLQVTPVQQPSLTSADFSNTQVPLPVTTALPTPLKVAATVIPASPTARTQTQKRTDFLNPSLYQQVKSGLLAKPEVQAAGAAVTEVKDLAQQFLIRPTIEATQSMRPNATDASYTPGSKLEKSLVGQEPISSIQKKVADQYARQSTSENPLIKANAVPLAVGEGASSVLNDIPIVGGLIRGGSKATKALASATKGVPILKDVTAAVSKGAGALDNGVKSIAQLLTPKSSSAETPTVGADIATADKVVPPANEITPGLKSVNANQAADATDQIAAATPPPVEPIPLAPTPLETAANDISTPAYQRTASKEALYQAEDDARLAREQAAAAADTYPTDTPTFERRGLEAVARPPSEVPPIEVVNDTLRSHAAVIANDPQMAGIIGDAFRTTGSDNPLSLVMHAMAKSTDKAWVREMVQRLVPDADGNVLNRAVNSITGSGDITEVSQALTEASIKAKTPLPFGSLSDSPATASRVVEPTAEPTPNTTPVQATVDENFFTDPFASLKQEALKYKTADEFNKAIKDNDTAPNFNKLANGKQYFDTKAFNEWKSNRNPALSQFGSDGKFYTDPGGENYVTSGDIHNQAHAENGSSSIAEPPPIGADVPPAPAPVERAPVNTPQPVEGGLPTLAQPGIPEQIPAAPNAYEAIVKQIGGGKDLKGTTPMNDKINIDELKQQAAGVVANLSDDQLIQVVASTDRALLAHDPQSFAVARATLDRLYQLGKDGKNELASQQVSDVLDAMSKYTSKNAQGLRIVQEEFDNMPLPMKVRYLAKKIDAANANVKNYEPIAHDPARLNEVEAALTARLQASQVISERVAGLEDQLNKIAESAKSGQKVDADINGLVKTLNAERENLQISNGELVKYFQELVPGRTAMQKALVDFPKRMMLASFSGRLNDVATTAASVAHLGSENTTQAIVGRILSAAHLVKANNITRGEKGLSKVFGGVASGVKKSINEARGKVYVDNLQHSLDSNQDLRSGLRKAGGPIGRTIQSATELATSITKGVSEQRLVQLADREARQLNIPKGELRDQYIAARSAVPSNEMAANAQAVHYQMNNLDNNFISKALNDVGRAMEGSNSKFSKSGLGGLIKNQIMPFTSWLGGNIFNSITDKNVIAATIKFSRDWAKGNPEGAVRNLSNAINGAIQAYAIGYGLSKAGIMTDKNAEGFNDGGSYFHVGTHYIPVGQLGFFAPNIVLGQAVYNGLNAPAGKNPAEAIAATIGNYAWHGLALGNVLGTESSITKAYNAGTAKGGTPVDAAATATSGVVGQFIPGVTGDINSVLDQTNLNPTHEKADTRVQSTDLLKSGKQSQAKDVPASALKGIEARIPGVAQGMPRKAGVAANNFFDRVVHGDHETSTQIQTKVDAKTQLDISAANLKAGIPDPNAQYKTGDSFDNAVQVAVENKKYGEAAQGLQQKLDGMNKDSNTPKSKKAPIEMQIKRLGVLKAGDYDPSIIDLYKNTAVGDWQKMGDSTNELFDQKTYDLLWQYDNQLAKAGASGDPHDPTNTKFTVKPPGKGHSSSDKALTTIKSNTINPGSLSKFSFGSLSPQKISTTMPTIQSIQPSQLAKARAISVSKGR